MSSPAKKQGTRLRASRFPLRAPELLTLLLAGSAASASAQTAVTPGTVLDTVRPPVEAAPAPRTAPALSLPAPQQQNLDPNAPRTRVDRFRIVGNRAIPAAELEALVAPYAGRSYKLADLAKLTAKITDYYREHGYAVARAVVPAQKIENGVLTIEVIEGRIDKAVFRGNKRYSSAFLERWAQPLVGREVRLDELEERVLGIEDLPGMSAQAVLTPGTEYGTTTVDFAVQEKNADGELSINNHGRREVGQYRIDASANLNNPFGIGDQLGARTSYSERGLIKMGGLSYSLPVNVRGTRLAASYTSVDYGIGGDLADLNINGKSQLGSVTLIHPLLRSLKQNFIGTLGLRYFSGEQSLSSTPISKSSILVAEAGMAWNRVDDRFNISAAGLRVSSNFRSDTDGTRDDTQRFKLDLDASHLHHLSSRVDLRLAGGAQVSSRALADAEKFSLGGPNSVRGYPAADVRGDGGVFASIEGRYRTNFLERPSYLSLFADSGYVTRRNAGSGSTYSNTIASLGVGFNFLPAKAVAAELAAALPTTSLDPSDKRSRGRIWFNLITRF